MKLSSSESWEVEPGDLVRWRPVPVGEAEGTSTPISESERFHLAAVAAGQPGWMALTLDFPESLDPDRLGAVVGEVVGRHDVLRGHYVRTPDSGFARLLHPAAAVEAGVHEACPDRDARDLGARLAREISETCDPFGPLPHFLAAVIRPDSTTLICAFDHCYVDARSLSLLTWEICELTAGRGLPPAESGLDALRRMAEVEASVPPDDPRVADWGRFLAAAGWRVPEFPLDLGVATGAALPVGTMVRTLLSAEDATRFSATVRGVGARTYPALLSCAGKAIRAVGGPREVATVVPAGTGAGPGCVCWSVGNAPLLIWSDGDLAPAMTRNTDRLANALPLAGIGLTPVFAAYGDRLRPSRNDVFMMSYVDYTRVPAPAGEVTVRQVSCQKPTDTAQWWFWRDEDGIHVRVRYPDTERAVQVLAGTLDEMTALVGSVLRAGGSAGGP